MTRLLTATALAALLCACGASPGAAQQSKPQPHRDDPPNVPSQRPAFPGQTRAPAATGSVALNVATFAQGLERPWGEAFLPDGRLLVTERPGRLRIVGKDGQVGAPIVGLPAVASGGQLGLYGLALSPGFASDRTVFLAFSAPAGAGSALSVARGKLSADGASLTEVKTIFTAAPDRPGTANIGGRLAFLPDGTLAVSVGDRFDSKAMAQTLDNDLGKLVRITRDGAVPKDNPFVGQAGARPEIWSYGHRNPEALAVNPWSHKLWDVEHGARGGDEINVPQPGKNYGWPVITYGEDYSGAPIGDGITQKAGMEQPHYYWDPVIAPSGMAFYDAGLFPTWKGNLFIGGLASKALVRLTLDGDKVTGEERLLLDQNERLRDVIVGPDGALYVLTDNDHGRVLKVTPK